MSDPLSHSLVTEVLSAIPDRTWQMAFARLHPGAFIAVGVVGPNPSRVSLGLRRAGFVLRDTVMVFSGNPQLKSIPYFLFRKPLSEPTLVGQVLKTGTGVINIDGCRVKHAGKADFEAHKAMVDAVKAKGGVRGDSWKNSSDLSGANDVSMAGRWPANVLFVHSTGCKLVGEEKVNAPVINRFTDGAKPFGNGAGHPFESVQTGDENGQESIGVYECAEECPAQALNDQSGILTSGKFRPVTPSNREGYAGPMPEVSNYSTEGSQGGASRFFSQFECAPDCPVPTLDQQSGIRPSTLTGRADPNSTHGNPSAQEDANGLFWGNGGGQVYADSGGASRFFSQFECSEDCPVQQLGDQSGVTSSGAMKHEVGAYEGESFTGFIRGRSGPSNQHGDSGTAARFFSQFEASPELRDWFLRLVCPPGGKSL